MDLRPECPLCDETLCSTSQIGRRVAFGRCYLICTLMTRVN